MLPVCTRSHCPTILVVISSIHSEIVHILQHMLCKEAACMREFSLPNISCAYSPIYFAHTGSLYARNHAVR